jgi:2-oxoglutarate dehydrogenase E2 component (dihydrolipoamide succinyltransferase)
MATDILVPELGESVTEGTVASWLKKPGDAVAVDENLLELETDKVTLEVPSPVAGKLLEALVEEGATVEVGAILARVAEGEGAASAPVAPPATATSAAAAPAAVPNAATAAAAAPPPAASQSGNGAATVANGQASGPAVAKMLAEAPHIDPASLSASGRNGRLTKGDVQTALLQPSPASPAANNSSREERVPLSRLRQSIARNLKQAQNTAAILTTYNEVDMTAVMALRKAHQEAFVDRYGFKLGFMSFFVKATVAALKQLPAVNAEIDGNEIVYKNYANIGVAVGTERGLVVPVIRDADLLSFAQIEAAINDFGSRARAGKIDLAEMQGGTFTISNGGVYGSLMSAPILNPPQSGILGMHKIQERPVVVKGDIVVRPMMYLALSYDHRIVDGREAVTFLVKVKDAIEDPSRLLFDL